MDKKHEQDFADLEVKQAALRGVWYADPRAAPGA